MWVLPSDHMETSPLIVAPKWPRTSLVGHGLCLPVRQCLRHLWRQRHGHQGATSPALCRSLAFPHPDPASRTHTRVTVQVWDVATGTLLTKFLVDYGVRTLRAAADGTVAVTCEGGACLVLRPMRVPAGITSVQRPYPQPDPPGMSVLAASSGHGAGAEGLCRLSACICVGGISMVKGSVFGRCCEKIWLLFSDLFSTTRVLLALVGCLWQRFACQQRLLEQSLPRVRAPLLHLGAVASSNEMIVRLVAALLDSLESGFARATGVVAPPYGQGFAVHVVGAWAPVDVNFPEGLTHALAANLGKFWCAKTGS